MPEIDRGFLKDLKTLDKRLSVKFNGDHFIVCFDRGYSEPVNVYRVKADDGGFRQPDRRDLEIIKGGDLNNGDRMEVRLKKIAYASEKIRRQMREKARNEIRDMTKDNRLQLKRWIGDRANSSKSNAEFRRIPHKPSKRVVRTIESSSAAS
jgi:hypothetical protein